MRKLRTDYNAFSTGSSVCTKIIRRILKRNQLAGRAASKKILLRQKTRMERKQRCTSYRNLSGDDWSGFAFSDECRFNFRSDGRVWVWRPDGKRNERIFIKSMSNDRRSLHFWGTITINCVMPLIKAPEKCSARNYIDILETADVPSLPNNGITFVADNCPIHRARIVKDWKRESNVQEYSRPSHSPDLNPVENVWAYAVYGIRSWEIGVSCRGYLEQNSRWISSNLVPVNA